MFKKILLAADGSEHSLRAADTAVNVAKNHSDSVVHILYVLDGDDTKSDVLQNWNSPDFSGKRKAMIVPVEEKLKQSGISYRTELLRGDPGPSIVQYANNHDFDLVVIGSRGLNPLQEFVLGSVSHKVAKRVHCSVLIVK